MQPSTNGHFVSKTHTIFFRRLNMKSGPGFTPLEISNLKKARFPKLDREKLSGDTLSISDFTLILLITSSWLQSGRKLIR